MRWFMLLLVTLIMVIPAAAQTPTPEGPDYTINNLRNRFTDDGQAVVEFEVWNRGGAATVPATALLNVLSTGEEAARAVIEPLQPQAIVTVTLAFPISAFPPDSVQTFRVAVGVDEIEAAGSANIRSNFAPLTISFPPLPPGGTLPEPTLTAEGGEPTVLEQIRRQIPINWNDPVQVGIATGIGLAVLAGIVLLLIVLRLFFSRPPHFEVWQPPYASALFADPNSPAGRRSGWQLNAQNASLPANAPDGTWHIRKLPTDPASNYLSGWRVTGLRMSQYDPYGRVSRSQVLANSRILNRINGALRARAKRTPEQLSRQLRPAATALGGALRKRVNERSLILPVAVDVQLQARHDLARIHFELYQRQSGQWLLADQWEPEMLIPGRMVEESFTVTLYGLRAGETVKTFRSRFDADLTAALVEMLVPPLRASVPAASASVPSPRADAPTDPHLPPVIT